MRVQPHWMKFKVTIQLIKITIFSKCLTAYLMFEFGLLIFSAAVGGVQEMIYRYEGTLCRFIVDDKGSGLLAAFGLPPAKHENDPLRAVKAAIKVARKMETLGKSARYGNGN
jgi:hypothetical protein